MRQVGYGEPGRVRWVQVGYGGSGGMFIDTLGIMLKFSPGNPNPGPHDRENWCNSPIVNHKTQFFAA